MTNFLNFPQLILFCVYFKFQEKEASKGLIGEEWGGKFGGFGQDLNPRLKIWMENVKKNFGGCGIRPQDLRVAKPKLYH